MIQGAPGAGKTALLHECKKRAEKDWKVVDLYPNALWSPDELSYCLGKKNNLRVTGVSAEIGVEKILKTNAGFSVEINPIARTMIKILQDGKNNPLLLILDEAQSLGSDGVVPAEMKGVITSVLYKIHNGKLGRPVMLLMAGLGTTTQAFKSLNISRFMRKCMVSLGCLSHKSTCAVIRDFFIHKGGVTKPAPFWVETIAEHTHGWPQHIITYADPAIKYLRSNNHRMTDEGLEIVIQQGRAEQIGYYDERAEGIDEDLRQALARSFANSAIDEATTRPAIMSSLKQNGLTQEEADALFTRALEQGIIDNRTGGRYGIPIPSIHTWLLDEYEVDKSQSESSDIS